MPTAAALDLHHALFRRQKAEISAALRGARTPALRAYERRYERRTQKVRRTLTRAEVERRLLASDVIYVGDYHTLPTAQRTFAELVAVASQSDRRTVMGLEFIEARHQATVYRYLRGELGDDAFFTAIERAGTEWEPFQQLLISAKRSRIEVIALDVAASGANAIARRDAFAADRIARVLAADDHPRLLVLTGQFHVAPCHLPAQVRARSEVQELVLYQNCEGAFWEVAHRRPRTLPDAVELADGSVCLFTASPVLCQQSFLDHLDSAGEFPVELEQVRDVFRALARKLARHVGIEAEQTIAELEVATPADLWFLDALRSRARFTGSELEQVRAHVLDRQSCYFPAAKMAYLASLSWDHAAEEAAHFVRHLCIDEEMTAPRSIEDAFYARTLEEALGFLGSKLVHPDRQSPALSDYVEAFSSGDEEHRAVAAFVLAHKAAEADGPEAAAEMLPLQQGRMFHAVTHALGYLLGAEWYQAYLDGALSRRQVRALFRDPFRAPGEAYFALAGRSSARRFSKRSA